MSERWDPEKRRIYQREYIKLERVRKKRQAYMLKYNARPEVVARKKLTDKRRSVK